MNTSPGAGASGTTPASAPQSDRIERVLARAGHAPLREGNRLTLLRDGPETFGEWEDRIRRAEKWVHFENYFFLADEVGYRFARALSEKAREGVPVRVIYDRFGSSDAPRAFWDGMRDAGVEVRAANPPTLRAPLRAVSRDHRKIVGVDGVYASTGGVCVSEGWLQRSENGLIYRDTAVGVEGPAVADLERGFARMWDAMGEDPLPDAERIDADSIEGFQEDGTRVRVVLQGPGRLRILRVMELSILAAEERLWISDPYFLSTPRLSRALLEAARGGVDVRVVLPATNDHPSIGTLERAGYRRFLEAGGRVFEYLGPMMYAKTTVVDGRFSRVGSTNLNIASFVSSWEVDLLAEAPSFGAQMEDLFEYDFANSREISPDRTTARRAEGKPGSGGSSGKREAGRRRAPGVPAVFSRVGGEVIRQGVAPVGTQERAVAGGAGVAVLAASLLGVRFPRLVAWPLAAAGVAVGAAAITRAAQPGARDEDSEQPPSDAPRGSGGLGEETTR